MKRSSILALARLALAPSSPAPSFAHCDTLDGPVIVAARMALDSIHFPTAYCRDKQ
ncbi:hypothetical protein Q8A64_18080 [Oxalobacteraceae bacterium R-40]|uniref:Uncharacterized protein n=1 Tax=Keguizhuia sedimenti TaxID=3064264 RepID=A0ABU1BTH3_9BURK|nr:hypothetical protein [Oxalobacteraceae bacterium R-40]